MENKICINITSGYEELYSFNYNEAKNELVLIINYAYFKEEKTFNQMLEKNKYIEYAIEDNNDTINYRKELETKKRLLNRLEKCMNINYENFIKSVNTVEFSGDFNKISDFINNNQKQLEKYKIIIPESDKLKDFLDKQNNINKYLIKFDKSSTIQSYKDYRRKKNDFNQTIENIKSLKLSNLENIILVSDLVREKVYKSERSFDYTESRDIWNILYNNDKIVCSGYTTLFNTILEELGILSSNVLVRYGNGDRHVYSQSYIEDEKYGVNGLFFSDHTSCAKNSLDNSSEYLYRYHEFLKPFSYFHNKYKRINETYEFFNKKASTSFSATTVLDFIKEDNLPLCLQYPAIKALKNFIYLICGYTGNSDYEEIIKVAQANKEKIDKALNQKIELSTFIKALAETRYIENYCDKEKYPFSLINIFVNEKIYGFKTKEEETPEERLLRLIFGEKGKIDNKEKLKGLYKELKEQYNKYVPKVKKVDLTLYRYK